MDKLELRKVIVSVACAVLVIVSCVVSVVLIRNSGISEIRVGGGSAAYTNYMAAFAFALPANEVEGRFVLAGAIAIYLGMAMLISGAVVIILKRSFRYIFLPIAGFCAIEVVAFLLQAYYQCLNLNSAGSSPEAGKMLGVLLTLIIILSLLGLACLVLSFIFPRRLVAAKSDDQSK